MKRDLIAVLFALVFPTLLTLAYFVWLAGTPMQNVIYAAGKTLQFAFPVLWTVVVLREKLAWPRPWWRTDGMALGLAFGVLVLLAMLALYHLLLKPWGLLDGPDEAIRSKVLQLQLNTPLRFIALGAFYALFHSLMEEYYWRWFVFGRLKQHVSLIPAVIISSAGFMIHHVVLLAEYFSWQSPQTYIYSLAVALGGAFWAWLYHRSESLYGPWIGHLLIDAAIFLIGFDVVRDLLG